MIDPKHSLSIKRQAELVGISRGSVYYLPKPVSQEDLALMRRMDLLHLEHPFMGSRMLRDMLNRQRDDQGQLYCPVGRKRVRTLMARMGIEALYRKSPAPARSILAIPFILICCGVSPWSAPIRSGLWIPPTFPWRGALYI